MNGRWKDFINLKEKEVSCSFVLTIISCIFLMFLDFYGNFDVYESTVQSICLEVIGGMIGLLGFALSGVAIIVSLFSEKQIKLIEQLNKPQIIEDIMTSFVFLAICAVIDVVVLFFVNMAVSSNMEILGKKLFYIICFLVLYFIYFALCYTVSLVHSCIELFTIKKVYSEIENKDFFHRANEIRINFILISLLKSFNISQEELVEELDRMVDAVGEPEKEKIKEYFHKTYLGPDKQ